MRSLSTGHSAWSHHELKQPFLPFPIHTPKAPQNKIFPVDFTGLENQAPDGDGGGKGRGSLISHTPEGHLLILMKCTGAVKAEAGWGLRRAEAGLVPRDHMQGLSEQVASGAESQPPYSPPPPGSLPPADHIPSPQETTSCVA